MKLRRQNFIDEACAFASATRSRDRGYFAGATFGPLMTKATNYLTAGTARVWIVDPRSKSITVFYPDAPSQTFTDDQVIEDTYLEGLHLTVAEAFERKSR